VFKKLFPEATFIESSTTGPKLQQIVADWNNGDIPVLFGHPSSIGHGLNLQKSSNTVLFYSLDFNLENYLQFIKRVCRQGQKQKHVIIHYLVFKNTIDEHIQAILSGKDSLQNVLLDFLKV
jgi:SNF2 family DNA or RNA helicase